MPDAEAGGDAMNFNIPISFGITFVCRGCEKGWMYRPAPLEECWEQVIAKCPECGMETVIRRDGKKSEVAP